MLEKLVFLCRTFGGGALATGCHVPAVSLVPHRIHSLCTLGRYGQGKQVAIGTVSWALSVVGTTVALAYEGNRKKYQGENILVPRLAQMMEGWRKDDPPTKKNFQW